MTHFYTHVRHEAGYVTDEEGQQFASLGDARRSALKGATEFMADGVRSGRSHTDIELYIHDETGKQLATLPFSVVVTGLAI